MVGLRSLIRARWSGRLLAVGLAYLLATEALIASIGIGMSAASVPGQLDFAICSSVVGYSHVVPPNGGDRNKSGHQSQCPFCFLAAQSALHLATIGDGFASPAYAELEVTALRYRSFSGLPAPSFYRTTGDPRGPPQFSV